MDDIEIMTRRDLFGTLASVAGMCPGLIARREPEYNLHAAIPADLLAKLQAVAAQERITLDEVASVAIKRWLASRT
jgi:hypothetical protein